MTHTPGPWTAVLDISDDKGRYGVMGVGLTPITGWGNVRQLKADANLIAAAPDLLDALVRAEQMIRILVLRGVFSGDYAEIAENEAANFRALVMKVKGLPPKEEDPGYFGPEPEDFT